MQFSKRRILHLSVNKALAISLLFALSIPILYWRFFIKEPLNYEWLKLLSFYSLSIGFFVFLGLFLIFLLTFYCPRCKNYWSFHKHERTVLDNYKLPQGKMKNHSIVLEVTCYIDEYRCIECEFHKLAKGKNKSLKIV